MILLVCESIVKVSIFVVQTKEIERRERTNKRVSKSKRRREKETGKKKGENLENGTNM